MFREKVKILMDDFGIKQEAIIALIKSNRNSFGKKMKDNTFTEKDKMLILEKYGSLL